MSSRRVYNELFIEFDGQQIEVRTDERGIREFFERTYRTMLVPRLTVNAGLLEVFRRDGEWVIRGMDTLVLDGNSPVESLVDYLRREVLFQFIKSRPDLLWVHAAAVERDGSALLLVGPSGQGKSTISTRLCELGWRLLSDDAAPIRMESNEVLPFHQAPHRRIPAGRELSPQEMGMFQKQEVAMPIDRLSLGAATISGIVFPLFKHGASVELSLRPPGEAALDLLRNTTNYADHKESAVERLSDLARAVAAYSLSYGDSIEAVRVLEGPARADRRC